MVPQSSYMGQILYTSTRYNSLHFVAADCLHHRLCCAALLALQGTTDPSVSDMSGTPRCMRACPIPPKTVIYTANNRSAKFQHLRLIDHRAELPARPAVESDLPTQSAQLSLLNPKHLRRVRYAHVCNCFDFLVRRRFGFALFGAALSFNFEFASCHTIDAAHLPLVQADPND